MIVNAAIQNNHFTESPARLYNWKSILLASRAESNRGSNARPSKQNWEIGYLYNRVFEFQKCLCRAILKV